MTHSVSDFYGTPYCVYAHFVDDRLIYIGSGTLSRPFAIRSRQKDHLEALASGETRVDILFRTNDRNEALERETALIKLLHPPMNKVHVPTTKLDVPESIRVDHRATHVLNIIRHSIKNGESPTNAQLSVTTGYSKSVITRIIRVLRKSGHIIVHSDRSRYRRFGFGPSEDSLVKKQKRQSRKVDYIHVTTRTIIDILTRAAMDKCPCPSNADIAQVIGSTPIRTGKIISNLVKRGILAVEVCRTGRIIHIGGHSTLPTANHNVKGVATVERKTRAVDWIIV